MESDFISEEEIWEAGAVDEGKRRILKELGLAPAPSRALRSVAKTYFEKLHSEIRKAREEAETKRQGAPFGWAEPLQSLEADTLGFITLCCILETLARPRALRDTTRDNGGLIPDGAQPEFGLVRKIAETCRLEHFAVWLRKQQLAEDRHESAQSTATKPGRWAERAYSATEVKRRYIWLLDKFQSDKDSLSNDKWLHLGGLLVHLAKQAGLLTPSKAVNSADNRDQETTRNTQKMVSLSKEGFALIEVVPSSYWLPMIHPPTPWSDLRSGGYLTQATDLVRHWDNPSILKALNQANLERVYSATNALQETPWRINHDVYDVMTKMQKARQRFPGVPRPEEIGKAAKRYDSLKAKAVQTKDPGDWAAAYRAKGKLNNLRLKSFVQPKLIKDRLELAARCTGKTLYFPYFLDFRGRAYPVPPCFNPQSDDQGRALLEFVDGKLLGARGNHWLAVHLANMWGHGYDKKRFEERVQWVTHHKQKIKDSASEPLKKENSKWWKKAKNPWRFLAACKEWSGFLNQGESFESRLPITMDGTCNGFQHLSAMLRDDQGGRATNLAGKVPNDIYTRVAKKVKKEVVANAAKGDAWAQQWLSLGLDRAVVKPGVMTTPYGAGTKTKRKQLIEAVEKKGKEVTWEDTRKLVSTLNKCIREVCAAHSTVEKWLKNVAKALAGPSIYELVQQKLKEKLQQNATTDDSLATKLLAIIQKNCHVLELGARITEYEESTTKRGLLMSDLAKKLEGENTRTSKAEAKDLANYLGLLLPECVVSVLADSPAESRDVIRSWLKKGGKRLAGLALKGKPIHWTTPAGFPVVQAEWTYPEKQVRSRIFGTFTYRDTEARPVGIDRNNQVSAITPQFVHSFDAAHMMLTINALHEQKFQYFAVVHDSYAVHACDVDKLNEILRDTFVRIYRRDVLEDFWQEQNRAHDGIDIPKPPIFRGKLDIEEVRNSRYFFC